MIEKWNEMKLKFKLVWSEGSMFDQSISGHVTPIIYL